MIAHGTGITEEGLALLARTQPLSGLSRDFGRGVPEADSPCSRPPGVVEWHLWTSGPVNGRVAFVVTEHGFEAIAAAAIELGVETGAVRIVGWTE